MKKNKHYYKAMQLAHNIPNECNTHAQWRKRAKAVRKYIAEIKLMLAD